MKNNIIFGKPYITRQNIEEIIDSLKNGWLGKGPKTALFEKNFSEYCGGINTVGTNSCTAALFTALKYFKIKSGDEVIVPAMTFAATANVIENAGATVVFADVKKNTGIIDTISIEEKISSKTRAIIPVHYCGYPCDMDLICNIVQKKKIAVISDAAHCIEGKFKGRHVSQYGDAACFSFYATKNITTGDGGIIASRNKKITDFSRLYTTQGLSADAWTRQAVKNQNYYQVVVPGMKFNMIDLQAALGLDQLKKIEKFYDVRLKQWKIYCSELKDTGLTLPSFPEEKGSRHSLHLFTIIVDKKKCGVKRSVLQMKLSELGIGTGIHFNSLHNHKYYKEKYKLKKDSFPVSDYISERTLSLPIGPSLAEREQEYIIEKIKRILKNA